MKRTRNPTTILPASDSDAIDTIDSDDDDSVKDKDFVMEMEVGEEDSDSEISYEVDNIIDINKPSTSAASSKTTAKRKKTERKQKQNPKSAIAASTSSSKSAVPIAKKYLDYFQTDVKDGMKFGICVICTGENVETKIKMKDSNTKGLKYHLSKFHEKEYNIFFGSGNIDPKQRTLIQMFGAKRKIQVSFILHWYTLMRG